MSTSASSTTKTRIVSVREAKYGLPSEVRFCTRCVISNQRPSSTVEFRHTADERKETIAFDANGVCHACRYAAYKASAIDWAERERELRALCDRYRRTDGSYDCVVPGSGGKDSSFTAHVLKDRFGMHPLCVTWAPHLYTEIGWQNFTNWSHVGGLDTLLFTPNGRVHRVLTRLAFERLAHPFQPFIIGQKLIGPRIANAFHIPLIFYGENQAEYGNNIEENDVPVMQSKFYAAEDPCDGVYLGGVSVAALQEEHGCTRNDLTPYLPLRASDVAGKEITMQFLGYYLKWDPQECYYYAAEHTGFQANTERTEGSYSKYSSIDDKIDPFHYYTTLIKFGIGRATYDAAQEIRNGKITREEGVALVHRYDAEFPKKYFREVLTYMGITEEQFWDVIDAARSPHLWECVGGKWHLRHRVS